MSTYPILNNEPELIEIKTKDVEIKDLKYRTEKHDYENILKSLKIDSECYKKIYKFQQKETIYECFRNFNRCWWFKCW